MKFSLQGLLSLAWPIVLSRATQAVIGFSDALMVAPLGEDALAAATTGGLNTFLLIILPMGTAFILQSFAAQLRGRGQLDALPRYALYGLLLALGAGLLALCALPFVPWLNSKFAFTPEVQALMNSYMAVRLLSVAPATATEALGNWYGGLGNTRIGMVASVAAMLTNLIGNYALIMPRFGLPGYGVAGAAWASTAGTCVGCAVVLTAFLRGVGYERSASRGKLSLGELRRVLRFGLPNGVNWFLEFAAFTLFINVVVGHLGTTALAAFNVVMSMNSVSFMPAFGVTSAGAIFVGEAIGRRAHHEVGAVVKTTGLVAASWMGAVGILYWSFPRQLFAIFQPDAHGSQLAEAGTLMLGLAAFWQLFDALSMTVSEALRAAGDTAWCLAARLVLAWVLFTPIAWYIGLYRNGGITGIMFSLIAYMAALTLTMVGRFASGRWKQIDLVSVEPKLV
ncbi:MAG TPA: MATE family efflux transporter [Polyangiaceae bacterium]|nr:MATE family efflux transporter [Polyangiaceae bacterium]